MYGRTVCSGSCTNEAKRDGNHVRKELPRGWRAAPFPQRPGHRPDFLAVRQDRAVRVSARFALPKGSKLVEKSVDRLGRGEDDPSELDGEPIDLVAKVVVVPDRSRARPSEGSERVQVLTQPELAGFLRSR